jgi:hypothetical protein
MSLNPLEREVLAEARVVFCNPKLRLSELCEWSNSKDRVSKNLRDDEVMAQVPNGFWVAVCKTADKRKAGKEEKK